MEQAAGVIVELQRRIVTLPKPVVARVHGNVRAGGIGIVAAADIAISADDATYAFTEVRLGLAPAAISLTVLPRMTDRSAALTFLTGDVFTGRDAERTGLVTRAVPEAELDGAVEDVCASLAEGDAQGLRETKRLVSRHLVERIDEHGAGARGALGPAVRLRRGARRDAGVPGPRGDNGGSSSGRPEPGVKLPTCPKPSRRFSAVRRLRSRSLSVDHVRSGIVHAPRRRGPAGDRERAGVRGPGLRPARPVDEERRGARPRGSRPRATSGTRAVSSSATRWSSRPPSGSPP